MPTTRELLGETLTGLRKRVRMSQRELSKHAEISYTQLGDLERAQGGNPSPLTLRSLAKGLATDDFAEIGYDPTRADAFYRQLMSSAGYLGGLPNDLPARRLTTEDVVEWMGKQTGDAVIAELLVLLAQKYAELSNEDKIALSRLAEIWVKM